MKLNTQVEPSALVEEGFLISKWWFSSVPCSLNRHINIPEKYLAPFMKMTKINIWKEHKGILVQRSMRILKHGVRDQKGNAVHLMIRCEVQGPYFVRCSRTALLKDFLLWKSEQHGSSKTVILFWDLFLPSSTFTALIVLNGILIAYVFFLSLADLCRSETNYLFSFNRSSYFHNNGYH